MLDSAKSLKLNMNILKVKTYIKQCYKNTEMKAAGITMSYQSLREKRCFGLIVRVTVLKDLKWNLVAKI